MVFLWISPWITGVKAARGSSPVLYRPWRSLCTTHQGVVVADTGCPKFFLRAQGYTWMYSPRCPKMICDIWYVIYDIWCLYLNNRKHDRNPLGHGMTWMTCLEDGETGRSRWVPASTRGVQFFDVDWAWRDSCSVSFIFDKSHCKKVQKSQRLDIPINSNESLIDVQHWIFAKLLRMNTDTIKFGTCLIFPYIGNNHSNWLIFFRGVGIPPTRDFPLSVRSKHLEMSTARCNTLWHKAFCPRCGVES